MPDILDYFVDYVPVFTDLVIYGSVALAAAVVYAISFFGIVGSFYRDSSPLAPPSRALGAALVLLAPVAAVFLGLGSLAGGLDLPIMLNYSPMRVLACLVGTPALLWLPALALCLHQPFRHMHMPLPPAAREPAAATADSEGVEGDEGAEDAGAKPAEAAEGAEGAGVQPSGASSTALPETAAAALEQEELPAADEPASGLASKKED